MRRNHMALLPVLASGVVAVLAERAQANPVIIRQPEDQTVHAGDDATFSVAVEGVAPLQYRWYFVNTTTLIGDGTAVLQLTGVQPPQAGGYAVVVTDSSGSVTSRVAQLTVLSPPFILAQPQSTNAPVDSRVTFRVNAGGTPPLSYQWQFNKKNLGGATNSTLILPSVTTADEGFYRVGISNAYGVTVSDEAQLRVYFESLPLKDNFEDRVLMQGSYFKGQHFNLQATSQPFEPRHAGKRGERSLWLSWKAPEDGVVTLNTADSDHDTLLAVYRDTHQAPTNSVFDPLVPVAGDDDSGPDFTSWLQFNAAAGEVYFFAVDGFVLQRGRVVLEMIFDAGAPWLTTLVVEPRQQTIGPGGCLTLLATTDSTSAIQWQRDGAIIDGAVGSKLTLCEPNSMPLEGVYRAFVDTAQGLVYSPPAEVQINTLHYLDVSARDKLGDAVEFTLKADLQTNAAGGFYGFITTQIFTTSDASRESGEPVHCGVPTGRSKWLVYQAPMNGFLRLDTAGSSFDTVLAVYTGSSTAYSALTAGACNDDVDPPSDRTSRVGFPTQAGMVYFIAVAGYNGAAGTVQLTIDFQGPPQIYTQPMDQTVPVGGNAYFYVGAGGLEPLHHQWTFNGTPLPGATNMILMLSNVVPSQAGQYAAVVWNPAGMATSDVAVLTVLRPPFIAIEPSDHVVEAGNDAVFSVAAGGDEPLFYQWLFNGTALTEATNATLVLSGVTSRNAGEYTVAVWNEVGSVLSRPALLTVLSPPVVVSPPVSQTWPFGALVIFAPGVAGSKPLHYQWQLNGVDIPGATSPMLVLRATNTTQTGTYRVVVSNSVGQAVSDEAVLELFEHELPFADKFEESAVLQDFYFHGHGMNVPASRQPYEPFHDQRPGSNSVWISWLAPESGVATLNTRGSDFDTLLAVYIRQETPYTNSIFETLQRIESDDDSGPYASSRLQFNAVAGTLYHIAVDGWRSQSGNIILECELAPTQESLPTIAMSPAGQTVPQGSQVVFDVEAFGTPPLSYQWQRNGQDLLNATGPRLVLDNVGPDHSGDYTVVISNPVGTVKSDAAHLLVFVTESVTTDLFRNNFADRQGLRNRNFTVYGNNFEATRELFEPRHAGKPGRSSMWISWIAPYSGIMTLATTNSDFDTLLAVYTNDSLKTLALVESSDDLTAPLDATTLEGTFTSLLRFNVEAGTVYHIAVDGHGDSRGHIVLEGDLELTSFFLPRFLAHPQNHTVQEGDRVALRFDSDSDGELFVRWLFNGQLLPNATGRTNDLGIITPDKVGLYQVGLFLGPRTNYSRIVEVQINSLGLTNVLARDKLMDSIDSGQIDPTMVSNIVGSDLALLDASQAGSPDPGQTNWVTTTKGARKNGGTDAAGFTTTQVFSTFGSTPEPGEPAHCGIGPFHSKWYSYQAPPGTPANARMRVNTAGSGFDTTLAVYIGPGTDYATLTNVACNNDANPPAVLTSELNFPASAGTVYFIAVDGVAGAVGTVHLNIHLGQPVQILTPPASQMVAPGTDTTFTVAAGGMTNLTYQWRFNGANILNATNASYTRFNAQANHAGNYDVVVSNPINSETSAVAILTVLLAPAITQQPVPMAVPLGGNAVLSVSVTGAPMPTGQWFFNNTALAGQTNLALALTNCQPSHQGRYFLQATNLAGSVTSDEVQLWLVGTQSQFVVFGPTNGAFQLRLACPNRSNYVIEASSNLTNWTALITNPAPFGILDFVDSSATNFPWRFYRAKQQ